MFLRSAIIFAAAAIGGPAAAQSSEVLPGQGIGLADAGGRCERTFANNDILVPEPHVVGEVSHTLRIKNGGDSAALIKVSEVERNERLIFHVAKGMTASISLDDGTYVIRYALGGHLAADCETVVRPSYVGRFPGTQRLVTQQDTESYSTAVLEYTLYKVVSGNVRPKTITTTEFNKD